MSMYFGRGMGVGRGAGWLVASVGVAACVPGAGAAAYRVEPMTIPSGGVLEANAVNAFGVAAVSLFGPAQAGTWDGGLKRALVPAGSDPLVFALGINNLSTVVGFTGNTQAESSPVKWLPGTTVATELPTLGIRTGEARDINERGDIVGWLIAEPSFGDAFQRAVIWPAAGGLIRLPTLVGPDVPGEFSGEFSYGVAINNRGDIVGVSRGDGGTRGFYRAAGADSPMIDVGTLGGAQSGAQDLNDFGEVVGNSRELLGAVDLPFRWRETTHTMTSLGTLRGVGAFAQAINNRGQIVGYDVLSASNQSLDRAFLINPGGTITDLNTLLPANSGWVLRRATAVNNAGVIVGLGRFQNQDRAFILTPDSPAAFVPCLADLNRDDAINTADLVQLLGDFGRANAPGFGADVNGDGSVNTADLVFFLGAFGSVCS